ncbi:hypothetical protein BS47DRAFT_1489781 [Hydnum rufescens UP504]|uniref:Uncharacterized protein n=1 Tax=Hydnum rufescens UP504 TaxID=1448309 RepID=A0A9P6AHF0_9AGAM|nr:hypothetical protein BS47DRAFT_1489781 [Hydnum rufescens UP504]
MKYVFEPPVFSYAGLFPTCVLTSNDDDVGIVVVGDFKSLDQSSSTLNTPGVADADDNPNKVFSVPRSYVPVPPNEPNPSAPDLNARQTVSYCGQLACPGSEGTTALVSTA